LDLEIAEVLLVAHGGLGRFLGEVVHAIGCEQVDEHVPILGIEESEGARFPLLDLLEVPESLP
jgi:hypothetical protein